MISSRIQKSAATSVAVIASLGGLAGCSINKGPSRQTIVHEHQIDGRPYYPDNMALADSIQNVQEARRASQQLANLFAVLEQRTGESQDPEFRDLRAAFHHSQLQNLAQSCRLLPVERDLVLAHNGKGSFSPDLQRLATAAGHIRKGASAELRMFAARYQSELGTHYGTSDIDLILNRISLEPERSLEFSGQVSDPKSSIDTAFLRMGLWWNFLTTQGAGFFEPYELDVLRDSGKGRVLILDFDRRRAHHGKELTQEEMLADEEMGRAALALYSIWLCNRHPAVDATLRRFSSEGFAPLRGSSDLDGEAFHQFRIYYATQLEGEERSKWESPQSQNDMMSQVGLWWGVRNIADRAFRGGDSWSASTSLDEAARERDTTAPARIYKVFMYDVPPEKAAASPAAQVPTGQGNTITLPVVETPE